MLYLSGGIRLQFFPFKMKSAKCKKVLISLTLFLVLFSEHEEIKISSFIFEDVSSIRKAPAWEYFHLNQAQNVAQCQLPECAKTYYVRNGMTALFKHLRGMHNIDLKNDKK